MSTSYSCASPRISAKLRFRRFSFVPPYVSASSSHVWPFRISPVPVSPPPSLPVHPRASRLSFGIRNMSAEPRRPSSSLTDANPPLPVSTSDTRRRSLSSPTLDTHRFRQNTPRPAVVSSSWDDNKIPSNQYSLPPLGPANAATSQRGTLSSSATTTTATSSQDHLPNLEDSSLRSGPPPAHERWTGSIPKLDFVSHFEAMTQLNLKMESEELLTAEELGRALKYLFSRYHGVLDSVGEFKARLDGENAELRAQIDALKRQLLDNNAEVLRLKALPNMASAAVSPQKAPTLFVPALRLSVSARCLHLVHHSISPAVCRVVQVPRQPRPFRPFLITETLLPHPLTYHDMSRGHPCPFPSPPCTNSIPRLTADPAPYDISRLFIR